MKVYAAILREFWRMSYLVPGSAFILLALPTTIFSLQWYFNSKFGLNSSAYRATFSFPLIGWIAGFVLSLPIVQMNNRHLRLTIGGYAAKILRAMEALAIGIVAFLTAAIFLISYGREGFGEAMRWVPIFTYGAIGLGFLMAALFGSMVDSTRRTENRATIVRFSAVMTVVILIVSAANSEVGRRAVMFTIVTGMPFRVADVLCLLSGPALWPLYLKYLRNDGRSSPTIRTLPQNTSNESGWYLSRLLSWNGMRLKAELLAVHPFLLSYGLFGLVVGSAIAFGGVLLFAFNDANVVQDEIFPKELMSFWWYPITMMALWPAAANVVTSPQIGRVLLLPGMPSRKSFPHWIAVRFVGFWLLGACMALLPFLIVALWAGMSGTTLAIVVMSTLLAICSFSMLMFWKHPKRKNTTAKGGFLVRFAYFVYPISLVVYNPSDVAAEYSLSVCALVLSVAFVFPILMYRWGLLRWRTMKYVG